MFTTVEQVKTLTGYEVTLETVMMAQGIIEAFVGKTEAVIDKPEDLEIIGRATAYQSAYMLHNAETVFEQIAVKQIAQSDGSTTLMYENFAPFIAPLAHLSLRGLSWKGSRSVRTGPVFDSPRLDYATWWRIN